MLKQEESILDGPCCVYPKKSKNLHYRDLELNKQSIRDSYPLPLPSKVKDCLVESKVFSTLDLCTHKDCFLSGPWDGSLSNLPYAIWPMQCPWIIPVSGGLYTTYVLFVLTYYDDILIDSATEELYKEHLQQIFARLQGTGLTLHGHIGIPQVYHVENMFSEAGMQAEIHAVQEWPLP